MLARRRLASVLSWAAALAPAIFWMWPALTAGRAPSYRDQSDFFYPLKLYTADRMRSGEIPLWNPLSGTGEPWLANGQSGVFYPPTLGFVLAPPALAGALFLLLHFGIAVWGMRRFLEQEGISEAGALFGSAAFAASGFAVSYSAYWNHFGAWAWMPAIAALARSGLRTRGSVLGIGGLIGLQAMAGSPETSAATVLLAAALAIFPRAPYPEPAAPPPRWRPARRLAAGVGLGLALAGWVVLPMGELAAHSDRAQPLPAAERDYGSVAARDLKSLAGFAGRDSSNAYLSSVFLPPFALAAAAAAFLERDRRRLAVLLGAFALLGVVLAMAGFPGSGLRSLPPLDRLRYPAKALAWTSFGVAALAGLGLDRLRFGQESLPRRALLGLLAVGPLALAALAPLPFSARLACGIGSAAIGLLALDAGLRRRWGALLAGASAAALAAALAITLAPVPRFAAETELRRCGEPVRALAKAAGRVVTPPLGALSVWALRDDRFGEGMLRRQREALTGYTNLTCGVPTVRTAAPLRTAASASIDAALGMVEDPVAAGAAGARVLWTPFRPDRLPSRAVGEFFRAPIAPYRPRLSFVRGYRVDPDAKRAWARAASGQVDLTREVLLDRKPAPDPGPAEGAPLLVARIAEETPERLVAEVTANFPGLLVLTDLHYPGWVAEEDGNSLPILRADGYFRAVSLPAGTHRVVFRYRPYVFYAGAGISAAALLAMLWLWHQGEPIPRGRARA